MDPTKSYGISMALIRERLVSLEVSQESEASLVRAERFAIQNRKIIEGVAYAALSAVEIRNRQVLQKQRTKDADKLLVWLNTKGMLRLPAAQRIEKPAVEGYSIAYCGAAENDMSATELLTSYSRASAVMHERHPEALTETKIAQELTTLEQDAARLRSWLWLHIMFLKGEAILLQMGQFGTSSFLTPLTREGDLPPGV